MLPPASRIGAALSAIWVSWPSRASSAVWLARVTTAPLSITRCTGLAEGNRVCALRVRKTSASGRPRASASGQPVRRSAAGFMRVMLPAASVAITASAIELSVMARSSSLRARSACAWRDAPVISSAKLSARSRPVISSQAKPASSRLRARPAAAIAPWRRSSSKRASKAGRACKTSVQRWPPSASVRVVCRLVAAPDAAMAPGGLYRPYRRVAGETTSP